MRVTNFESLEHLVISFLLFVLCLIFGARFLEVGITSIQTWFFKILLGFKSIKLKNVIPACSRLGSCYPGVKDCISAEGMVGGAKGEGCGRIIIAGLSSERCKRGRRSGEGL